MALNKVILQGRLTAAPELKTRSDGTKMTSFCLACERNYKDEEGKAKTDFFRVCAYNFQAEFVCLNFGKGDGVFLSGSVYTNVFEDDSGKFCRYFYIVADEIYLWAKNTRTVCEKVLEHVGGKLGYVDKVESSVENQAENKDSFVQNRDMFEELTSIEGELPF